MTHWRSSYGSKDYVKFSAELEDRAEREAERDAYEANFGYIETKPAEVHDRPWIDNPPKRTWHGLSIFVLILVAVWGLLSLKPRFDEWTQSRHIQEQIEYDAFIENAISACTDTCYTRGCQASFTPPINHQRDIKCSCVCSRD